jgi:REP element-mobilizing transposase RayT
MTACVSIMPEPTYTSANTRAAYQLQWSYSAFWNDTPIAPDWLPNLQSALEPDGIRILSHSFLPPQTSQFLISTKPEVAPQLIAQRVKGRLQYLLKQRPNAFRRNYSLRSLGSTKRDKVEFYIEGQLRHHPLADERIAARFAKYQIADETVDLSVAQQSSHALYWHNLHVVLVMRDRDRNSSEETLAAIHLMIRRAAKQKGHRLSRAAILPDHIHMALGAGLKETPEAIALSYMNNLVFATNQRLFEFGYWVGTFGDYDLGAIRDRESFAPPT